MIVRFTTTTPPESHLDLINRHKLPPDPPPDQLAFLWAVTRKIAHQRFEARWNDMNAPGAVARFRHNGKTVYNAAAGHARNKRMLDEGRPDMVIAFPGGKGTADMVRLAHVANVPVFEAH